MCVPKRVDLRRRHQAMLARMKKAPTGLRTPQQDEGEELEQVPGCVILHVKQHQTTVPERVDGAQHERRHQSREERAPQSLQREIITHLRDKHISIKYINHTRNTPLELAGKTMTNR